MQAFLGDLDTGPETCVFEQLAKSKPRATSQVDHFLGFAKQLRHRASEVLELINQYKEEAKLHDAIHKQLVTHSVARWIFYTNKIEFAGVDTEGDTEALITGNVRAKGANADDVLQTFELLKQSYSGETPITTKVFDVPRLQQWHRILFSHSLDNPGAFRKSGLMTTNLDHSDHVYPHHSIVYWATGRLCLVVHRLAKDIEQHYSEDPMERVLYAFALAAFAQYHFVDIHPFIDGNGRMCRFLSKVLLDSCCPLPFPMFEDRSAYLGALIDGRRRHGPSAAPLPLANLLLESASAFYRDTIARYFVDRPFTKLLVADDERAFRRSCEEEHVEDAALIERLAVEFNRLAPDQTKDIEVGHEKYRIKHYMDLGTVVDAL